MKNIRLFYYSGTPNFGDVLNMQLIPMLLKRPVTHSKPRSAELVAIGSLLDVLLFKGSDYRARLSRGLSKSLAVWGTGFISDSNTRVTRANDLSETFSRPVQIFALRGELTRARVATITGLELAQIALGDPGLLCNRLVPYESLSTSKAHRVGIIPHYVDREADGVRLLRSTIANSLLINVLDEPQTVLQQIRSCDVILSSAMHGLIAADSLGIPNARAIFSDKIVGGDYKFNDYYSVFGMSNHRKVDLRYDRFSTSDLEPILDEYPISRQRVEEVCDGLICSLTELGQSLI